MAELRLLTARQLRQVYRERVRSDFPPSERRPLASMEHLRAAGVYDTWGMYEGEELLAHLSLTQTEGAQKRAESLRQELNETKEAYHALQGTD